MHGKYNQRTSQRPQGTLFCWKAKGQDNHLSAYHRSVPFELVLNHYKTKKRLHPESTLIDISEWNHSEKSKFSKKLGYNALILTILA